jgi:light-regulated signal transduction histidine kinase (bacteriophytochrome)
LLIIAAVFIVSLVFSLIVGAKLQKTISTPIKTLATAATSVSHDQNYSVRVDPRGTDEIRLLINAFNDMLDKLVERENQRDQAEHELRAHRDHLEELVHQRTAALEASNKELEAFSYSVSHDLRAPLRSIHGFSQILFEDYRDKLDDQGMDHLARIQSAAINMASLIDDLLQLARISRSDFTCTKLNFSEIAAQSLDKLQQQEPDRKIKSQIQENLYGYGDLNLLSVALDNLVGNAWKYTSKTGIAEIEFGRINSQNGQTVFFIKDNGAGFDMQYVDKIFVAFQRLHGPNEFPGTGIGLATVQRIINRHKGKIWAESEIGKGTTVFFSLGTHECNED